MTRPAIPKTISMHYSLIAVLLLTVATTAVRIPFVRDVTFMPISNVRSLTLPHRTCDQCLCESNSSHVILNCFPNDTCQLFTTIPRTYTLQSALNAMVFFPQRILPNASESCIPNTSLLFDQLKAATPTYVTVYNPRCLILDNHGYLVTISKWDRTILQFHPNDLTPINTPTPPMFTDHPSTLAHYNGAYYVGFDHYILAVSSDTMMQLHNMSVAELFQARDIIFLNTGQSMIVASSGNNRLLFFNRSSTGSFHYDLIGFQILSNVHPHGLLYVNDSFFYGTSWAENTLYEYAYAGNATSWAERRVLNASSMTNSSDGNHVSMDGSGRYWLSLGTNGPKIFDSQGSYLETINPMGSFIFDTLIGEDYVIYLSTFSSNQIIRIDPHIPC